MRRTTILTAAPLLGLVLLNPTGTATATLAGESCRGEAATIVGTPGATLVGTEGRDVVVTGGASTVTTQDGNDLVCIPATSSAVDVDLGAGDDELTFPAVLPAGSSVAGGDGRDLFEFGTEDGAVEWDLRGPSMQVDGRTIPATGIEDAFVSAPRVRLTGTNGPNDLYVNTCDGRLDGRDGRDSLFLIADYAFETFRSCAETMVFLGGGGNDRIGSRSGTVDRMVGGSGNDTFDARGGNDRVLAGPGRDSAELGEGRDAFYGGPGRDRVDGQQERDLCRAERRTRCER